MKTWRKTAYAAAVLLGAATITCAPVASASAVSSGAAHPAFTPYWEYATGYGATLSDAEADAESILDWGCTGGSSNGIPHLVSDGQESDGSWWAYMKAYCSFD
jgi:hypothetical protein